MGALPSRQLAIKILELANAAECNGQSAIKVDENLAQELLSFWKMIPQSTRNIITGKGSTRKKAQETAGRPASQHSQQDGPFHSNQGTTPTTAEEEATKLLRTDLSFDHLDRFSGTCLEIINARTSLIIRERFIKVTMGKLLGKYKKQRDIQEDGARLFFPQMRQDVKDWATEGRRLESLCQGLYSSLCSQDSIDEQHLGFLFILPVDMSKEL
ncbi:hypothetical protein N7540_013211 [Penicillium herquei]|nr:hypothetical protein N7540_013211 [Penicillium herquei]